jgi:hypothetical protein
MCSFLRGLVFAFAVATGARCTQYGDVVRWGDVLATLEGEGA